MEQYHGTDKSSANNISNGKIDVTKGGGELGQGFYTGDLPHEAFAWAWHRYHKNNNNAVVHFTLDDEDFLNLKPRCLDFKTTYYNRKLIKILEETRTYLFYENAVWAPIVGKSIPNFNQIKFESKKSENYLNGDIVIKDIL